MPKVSVIVPVYNAEKYIGRCIESVQKQTLTDWELILVDDGSPDNSGVICDEYASKDSRIRAFHKENGGVSSARNLGLDNANGGYISFLDSDDYFDTDCLEKCYQLCNKNKLDVLQYSIVRVCEGKVKARYCYDIPILNGYDYINTMNGLLCAGGNMIRSSLVSKTRFPNGIKYGEDRYFLLNILTKATRVMRTSSVDYYYEDNPNSASQNLNTNAITQSIDLTVKLIKEFPYLKDYFNTVLVGYILAIINNNDIAYNTYKKLIEKIPMRISKALKLHEIIFLYFNKISDKFAYNIYRYLFIIKKKL